ncbi:MAG: membrane lipoprotein lipid attachment site-containing protein [Erysipelotrichaceae bacterium]|nr:membrane lipoprotein lipid attachment site-containing protein [Erysipelotrichaceae bacterium]
MKKTIILILAAIMLAACSPKHDDPADDFSDAALKAHGLEVIKRDVKLDFDLNIINAKDIVYSDKEGDERGFALIDDKLDTYIIVLDRMFEDGNYYLKESEFEPSGIMASAVVDEDYTEYRQVNFIEGEKTTIYISYEEFDIMNNSSSYDLGYEDDQYSHKMFLTLKKDNKINIQKAEADEMIGDFQSIRRTEEYPVFEPQEKIERLFASGDVFDQRIYQKTSAIVLTENAVYIGFLSDDEFTFNKLEYLSQMKDEIYFISIDRNDVTIILKDGRVLKGDCEKLN